MTKSQKSSNVTNLNSDRVAQTKILQTIKMPTNQNLQAFLMFEKL
jgi:hypothetical protein